MPKPLLSIIIPVKNESERLPFTLIDIDRRLSEADYSCEIVVASFGSSDHTPAIVKKMSGAIKNLKLVVSHEDKGLGAAIRQGGLLSSGEIKLVTTAENLIAINQFAQMRPHFENGADLVIGHRIFGQTSPPPFQLLSRIPGQLLNLLLKKTIFRGLNDPTSNFIALTESAAEKVFNLSKFNRSLFWIELLSIARRHGLKIKETPVFVS